MTERIVVIGADAAGMSAASQAKRIAGDAVQIVAFERGVHSSYSACGIPYWVAGDVDGPERLVARSPEAHRRNGIDLRIRTEVEEIDLEAGRVAARDLAAGRSYREGFDSLVIATGAVPRSAVLAGMGSDPRGVTAGRRGSAPDWSRQRPMTRPRSTELTPPVSPSYREGHPDGRFGARQGDSRQCHAGDEGQPESPSLTDGFNGRRK